MNQKKITELIDKLTATKPLTFKIKGTGDNSPRPIHYYNSKQQFVPDFVISYPGKRDFYAVEMEIKEADISTLTFKWILFSSEARKMNGTFFLVIDKSKISMCEKIIQDKQLDIELIQV